MTFSIITPSFRQPDWLRLCLASVADQKGVSLEHIVQDSCSGPEVAALGGEFSQARLIIEKDQGMYDAVNRGLRLARGEICAYLNCDEQYLPGALAQVEHFFEAHPEVDIAFAYTVVANGAGDFLCARKVLLPSLAHTWTSHLSTFTCSTFFRRRILERENLFFDLAYRNCADATWVISALQKKVPMGILPVFTSAFADTGENMNLNSEGQREREEITRSAPWLYRQGAPAIVGWHRLRRWLGGIYRVQPFSYELYTRTSPRQRQRFEVARPGFYWKSRM